MRSASERARQGGYTVLEVVVALAIFSVLGYTIASAVTMAHKTHRSVMDAVAENRDRREAAAGLVEELASADADGIEVAAVAGQNHTLTFQVPITVGGELVWGVCEKDLGTDEVDWNKADWRVRYEVEDVPLGAGGVSRNLVRQVLDDEDVVQLEETVAEGLCSGDANPMGFSVVEAGDVWQVTLTTEGNAADSDGRSSVFHVKTRN